MAGKITRVAVHEDSPTGIAGTMFRANVNVLAFNLDFIGARKPLLSAELMELYYQAKQLKSDDPSAPEEDSRIAVERLRELEKEHAHK